jgi:hypothetical protein
MSQSGRAPGSLPPTSGPDEQLWQATLDDWDNPKLHDLLLTQAESAPQLASLAGRYRRLLDDATRKPVAEAQLKKIAAAAMARMDVQAAAPRAPVSTRNTMLMTLALLFLLGTLLLLRFL